MNSVDLMVGLIQWSAIWLFTGWITCRTLRTTPRLASFLCAIGMTLGASLPVALLVGLDLPRIGSIELRAAFQEPTADELVRNEGSGVATEHVADDQIGANDRDTRLASVTRIYNSIFAGLQVQRMVHWRLLLAGLLCAGAVSALFRCVIDCFIAFQLKRRAFRLSTASVIDGIQFTIGSEDSLASLEFRCSAEIESPAVIPFDRKTILVPVGFMQWPVGAKRAAVAHELSHLRHHDATLRLLIRSLAMLLWFNPIGHWLSGLFSLSQEMAADREAAVDSGGAEKYRRILAEMVLLQDADAMPNGSCVAWTSGHRVIRRITMLQGRNDSVGVLRKFAVIVSFTMTMILASGWGISFAQEETRIASLPKSAKSQRSFARERTEPWSTVEPSFGFALLRPSELPQLPMITSHFAAFETALRLEKYDLAIQDHVTEATASVTATMAFDASDERPFRLMFGSADLKLTLSKPVDWEAIASDLPWTTLVGDQTSIDACRDLMAAVGTSNNIRFGKTKSESFQVTDAMKQMWSFVDGGIVAVCLPIEIRGEIQSMDLSTLNAQQRLSVKMARELKAVGLGIDRHAIRISLHVNQELDLESFRQLLEEAESTWAAELGEFRIVLPALRTAQPQTTTYADGTHSWNYELPINLATLL